MVHQYVREKHADRQSRTHRRSFVSEIESHYFDAQEKVIFDKGREWANNVLALHAVLPLAVVVVMVRDLRAIYASIEKQHRANPLLDDSVMPFGKTQVESARQLFAPDGLIGSAIWGVEDIVRRRPKNCIIVPYEAFSDNPQHHINQIYYALGMDPFEHNFDSVENVAEDVDALYLDKFPHQGCGKVEPCNRDEWREYVAPDIAQEIMRVSPFYNQTFGYQ